MVLAYVKKPIPSWARRFHLRIITHAARTRAQRPRRRRASLGCDSASNGDPPSCIDYLIDTDWLFTFGTEVVSAFNDDPSGTVILLV
jgi:hypothetical protein